MTPVLTATKVTYSIGYHRLVDTVSLDLQPGELVAIVGPNGAGKSTLLQLLGGDLEPSAGTVTLGGKPLEALAARDLALERATMPQHTILQFAFTAEAVVAMGRHPHRTAAAVDEAAILQAMRDADVVGLAHRSYPTLSGGERQRVTFGRILAQATPLLLLDEPTTSLDLRHQEHLMETVRAIADRGGTVVAVLHDLNLAAAYADRLCLLHQGQLVASGSPEQILTSSLLDSVFDHPLDTRVDPVTGHITVTPRRTPRRHQRDAAVTGSTPTSFRGSAQETLTARF